MALKNKGHKCPKCGSRDVLLQDTLEHNVNVYVCLDCDHEFSSGGKRHEERREDHRDERRERHRERRGWE
ncbi:MAG: hypothetical protein JSV52_08010 [Candidatus Zixiibacteriota bacterium]|nr:MAG: hypothetical protein JSV52_08010 [candidate division Zixibacteria bacterium]